MWTTFSKQNESDEDEDEEVVLVVVLVMVLVVVVLVAVVVAFAISMCVWCLLTDYIYHAGVCIHSHPRLFAVCVLVFK